MSKSKGRKKSFFEKVINETELLPEAATNTFKLVMHGACDISIENVKKLKTCCHDSIIIETSDGNVAITGEDMIIREYGLEFIKIEGIVKSIDLISEREKA